MNIRYENSRNDRIVRVLPYIPLVIAVVIMVAPYYWMVISAFKSQPELQAVPPRFYVEQPTLSNFYNPDWRANELQTQTVRGLFQRYPDTPGGFMRYYFNSVGVAVINTLLGLLVASLGAFVFAKHQFPGRNALFLLVLASMMVPWQVTLIPSFMIVRDLKWLDTFTALIVPALPRAFTLFFLRQYMLSIPDELVDAARVDGASEWRIWARIMLPLIVPALVAMGLFMFIGEWNNLVWPLVVLQSEANRTLPLVMSTMIDPFSPPAEQGVVMAAALLVSLPTLLLFLVFQKQFVRGIALTGMKG
ncbi:MAG: carbohydrate ABC transporter permease [Chloroflexota bacterium]